MRLYRVLFCPLVPLLLWSQAQSTEPEKATLAGTVLNSATGQPVRKVRLTLRGAGRPSISSVARPGSPGPPPAFSAVSDASGRFEFTQVEPGSYQLQGIREGFRLAELATKEGGKLRGPILLLPGEQKPGILVRMTPLGVIAGRVTDEDGDPIRGVQIGVMSYQYSQSGRELVPRRSATSNDLGEYRIYDVTPGRFYLRAGLPMRVAGEVDGYATTFYPGSSDVTGAVQLEVSPGQELREMNLTLRRARLATIRGRLIAPEGATGMGIGYLITQGGGTSMTTRGLSDREGRFELVGMLPGPIFLLGSYSVAGKRMEVRLPLHIGSEDISGIELVAVPGMDIRGRVRIDGTSAVKLSQVALRFSGHNQSFGGGGVRDDGTFEFKDVAAGVYELIDPPPPGLYYKAMYWGDREITDTSLDLTSGAPPGVTLTVVFGADGGEVSGVVTDADSNPGFPAMIVLVPAGNHRSRTFYRTASTNAAGRFTLRSVAPGEYKLFAWDRVDLNQVTYDPDFLRPYENEGKTIRIQAGEKQSADLKLVLNKEPQ